MDPSEKLILIIIAILLPPLAVALKEGLGSEFLISLILTIFGFYILGVIYSLFVILQGE